MDLADMGFWNKALTPSEIQTLYRDPLAPIRKRDLIIPVSSPTVEQETRTNALITIPAPKPSYSNAKTGPFKHPSLRQGLIHGWVPVLGNTGTQMLDVVGNETIISTGGDALQWQNTSRGNALNIDRGNTDAYRSEVVHERPQQQGTISCLVHFDERTAAENVFFCRNVIGGTNNFLRLMLYDADGGFPYSARFGLFWRLGASGGDIIYGDTIVLDGWNHFVAVSDGNVWRLYVNGQRQSLTIYFGTNSGRWMGDHTSPTASWFGGQYYSGAWGYTLNGQIPAVYEWDRALSPSEIQTLYQDELAPIRKRDLVIPLTTQGIEPASTTKITQLSPIALSGKRYSFVAKSSSATPVSVALLTGTGEGLGNLPSVEVGQELTIRVQLQLVAGSGEGSSQSSVIAVGNNLNLPVGSGAGLGIVVTANIGASVSALLTTNGNGSGLGNTASVTSGQERTLTTPGSGSGSGVLPTISLGQDITVLVGSATGIGNIPSISVGGQVSLSIPSSGTSSGTGNQFSLIIGHNLNSQSGIANGVSQAPSATSGVELVAVGGTSEGFGNNLSLAIGQAFVTTGPGAGLSLGHIPVVDIGQITYNIPSLFDYDTLFNFNKLL
jgi:hypothetical protein